MNDKLYIIGDVHGCYDTLCALINQLPNKFDSKICFVGDLIDRGPNSKQVLELIINNKYDCVLGNHEEGFLYEIDRVVNGLSNNTFNPYSTEWYKNWGGIRTIESYKANFIDNEIEIINKHKDFLKSLPIFKEYHDFKIGNKHLVVSHGHIGSFWEDRRYLRTQGQKNRFKESVIWSRDFNKVEKTIFNVFGHTPVNNIEINENYVNIDTGVYRENGKLTCLEFPTMKIYQQDRIDIVR